MKYFEDIKIIEGIPVFLAPDGCTYKVEWLGYANLISRLEAEVEWLAEDNKDGTPNNKGYINTTRKTTGLSWQDCCVVDGDKDSSLKFIYEEMKRYLANLQKIIDYGFLKS